MFDAHLARWEAAEADPDGTVERVADGWRAELTTAPIPVVLWMSENFDRLAAAAIDALRPAPDAPRVDGDGCDCDEPYDCQFEEHARDLLRSWAVAASNAGCPPAFVARMRTFADMHDRHAAEALDAAS